MKTLNWAWNQMRNLPTLDKVINKKKIYDHVIDWFLGSWSILFNLDVNAKKYIWIDILEISPLFFKFVAEIWNKINRKDFFKVVKEYNNFNEKEEYYRFRKDWNELYENPELKKKDFVINTILLLKLCSNSIVRFNQQGLFNQWFRWVSKKKTSKLFFTDRTLNKIVNEYHLLYEQLIKNDYVFEAVDILTKLKKYWKNDLLILDPPYIDVENVYWLTKIWTEEDEKKVLDFLLNEFNWDFIYFNYLNKLDSDWKKRKHLNVVKFINSYKNVNILPLTNHTSMWQKRKGLSNIKEIILTNINKKWKKIK